MRALTRCDEMSVYKRDCSSTAANISGELEQWRYRRGLVVHFRVHKGGSNWWGVGHVLPTVIDVHHLCRTLRRFCYIRFASTSHLVDHSLLLLCVLDSRLSSLIRFDISRSQGL